MHLDSTFFAWERTRARRDEAERERLIPRARRHRRAEPGEHVRR